MDYLRPGRRAFAPPCALLNGSSIWIAAIMLSELCSRITRRYGGRKLAAACWTGLSGAEELADIGRIFARFSEGMPAWSLTDEFREPGFMLYLLVEDRER